jgi:hypothetical protein
VGGCRGYGNAVTAVRLLFYLLLTSLYVASITWGLTTSYHISVLLYSNTLINGSTRVSAEVVSALGEYVADLVNVGGGYAAAHSAGFVFWSTVAAAIARALGLGGGYLYIEHLRALNALATAAGILSVLYVERLALLYLDSWGALLVAAAYATGLGWVYSSIAYSQSFSAPFVAAGLYYLVRWIREGRARDARASLLALSLAALSDHTLAVLGVAALALVLASSRGVGGLAAALATYLVPLSAAVLYYRFVVGVPLSTQTAYAQQLGVVPLDPRRVISELSLTELVFGLRKGLIVTSPALAIPILVAPLTTRRNRLRAELLLAYPTLVALLLAYSSWYDWHGGLSYGPRVLLSVLPITALLLSISLSQSSCVEYLTAALSAVGAAFSGLAISTNPASCAYQELAAGLVPQPLACNYPKLAPGCWSPTLLGVTGMDCLSCFYTLTSLALLINLLPLVARVWYGGVRGKA